MPNYNSNKPCSNCRRKQGVMLRCDNCATLGCQSCLEVVNMTCKVCKKRGKVRKV